MRRILHLDGLFRRLVALPHLVIAILRLLPRTGLALVIQYLRERLELHVAGTGSRRHASLHSFLLGRDLAPRFVGVQPSHLDVVRLRGARVAI